MLEPLITMLKFSNVLQSESNMQHANWKPFLEKQVLYGHLKISCIFDWFFIGPQHMLYASTVQQRVN
jgi:hypothetical protein